DVETARWFESLLSHVIPAEAGISAEAPSAAAQETARRASNWVISDLFGALNRLGRGIEDSPVSPAQGAELLRLIADGTLSGTLGKQVFEIMLDTGQDPAAIVEERGLRQTSDTGAIDEAIAEVLAANPDKLAEYRSGKDKLFGFFVGQVMKAMQGKANPQMVNELLRNALG
ncbi:MAG: gatB, partial [Alphaproteobacteria bacterium]|nr:gatB [Alphaproteobacteria bacterium]